MADLTAVATDVMGAVSHRLVSHVRRRGSAMDGRATGDERPGTAGYGVALLSRFPELT
jgi:hypothetical protein